MAHSSTTSDTVPVAPRGYLLAVPRAELFAGLALVGFANGITGQAMTTIQDSGFSAAVLNTFGVSAIVWCAAAVATSSFWRASPQPINRADLAVAAVSVTCFLAPPITLSWMGLTGLAIYMLCTSQPHGSLHRGSWIVLAMTVPMCWAGVGLTVLPSILDVEAMLASWLAGTSRVGNVIRFADGWGYLLVEPGCSSLKNIALAVLCWMLFAHSVDRRRSISGAGWCLLACAAAIVINTFRLSVLALQGERFDQLHGTAAEVAGWITLGAVVGICWLGTRHERISRP
jgi:exosortase/archaeosortase family protein